MTAAALLVLPAPVDVALVAEVVPSAVRKTLFGRFRLSRSLEMEVYHLQDWGSKTSYDSGNHFHHGHEIT